jgi:hypothetical protein
MSKKQISRREAMGRVTKVVAMAAGLSATELKRLLSAQTSAPNTVILQKSANNTIKALKSLLENTKAVFESQYGRTTPVVKMSINELLPRIGNILPKDQIQRQRYIDHLGTSPLVCPINFTAAETAGSGALGATACLDSNTCTGESSDGCAHGNTCNGQTCTPGGFNCSGDRCTGQTCSGGQHLCVGNSDSIVSASELGLARTDPYIELLFKRYNVTGTQDLALKIDQVLSQRRLQIVR